MPRKEFNTDLELQGGPFRDVGHIIDNAEKYQLALSEHRGSTKLSSAKWFNCEYPPLDPNLPRECTILSILPPMSLHLFLGGMNVLCDILELILEHLSTKLRALYIFLQ